MSRFLISQTTTAPAADIWEGAADTVNEQRWVEHFVARFPRTMASFAYPLAQVLWGFLLLPKARKYDAVAVGRYGVMYPIFAAMLGVLRPTVLMDVERRDVKTSLVDRWSARLASRICCFTHKEIDSYSSQLDIPKEKFSFVPYCAQSRDLRVATADKGYVFSGGTQARDWQTMFQAVDGLPYPVHVFSDETLLNVPSNCTVRSVSRTEFFNELACSSCVVVCLMPEPNRVTGMLTFVTALSMGKPVILAGSEAGLDYIVQGVTGFRVDYGDANAVRDHLNEIMSNPARRREMTQAAKIHAAANFSETAFRRSVLGIMSAVACHAPRA